MENSKETVVVKLGGAVITEKGTKDKPKIREDNLNMLTLELAHAVYGLQLVNPSQYQIELPEKGYTVNNMPVFEQKAYVEGLRQNIRKVAEEQTLEMKKNVYLLNGGGCFGHDQAKLLEQGKLEYAEEIHHMMDDDLGGQIFEICREAKLPIVKHGPFPYVNHVETVTHRERFKMKKLCEVLKKTMDDGKMPNSFGDVVPSEVETKIGHYRIISADDIAYGLCDFDRKISRVELATNVPGICDKDPGEHEDALLLSVINVEDEKCLEKIDFGSKTDATGSMKGKTYKGSAIAKDFKVPVHIFDGRKKGNLYHAVKGDYFDDKGYPIFGTLIVPSLKYLEDLVQKAV